MCVGVCVCVCVCDRETEKIGKRGKQVRENRVG